MELTQQIGYYCFNKNCKISIYKGNVSLRFPLNIETISTDKFCKICNSKLLSLMDIEIKKTLLACLQDQF
jgi:hypothetical protein